MKVYQVVRRGGRWHVHMPDANPDAPSSQDKSKVVAWACELARKHEAAVQVRDRGGQIEMTYTYLGGIEQRYDREQSHADLGIYGSRAEQAREARPREAQRQRSLLSRLLSGWPRSRRNRPAKARLSFESDAVLGPLASVQRKAGEGEPV